MSAAPDLSLEELRFRLRGGLYEPGTAEFEEACAPFDSAADGGPRLVARCSAAEDVVAALAFAREQGHAVAVRDGGLRAGGALSCDEGLLVDLRGMRDVEVDPERQVARVGAGASKDDVERAVWAHGLAAGETPLAVQLVDPNGEIVRLADSEVLRDGAENIGVLVSRELQLHRIKPGPNRSTIFPEGP